MAMSHSLYECGNDEVRDDDGVTDICSYCATDGKLQPALHFCFDCGVYGRYICGICLKQHSKFLNNHEVERIANQSTSKRKKDSDSKVKALEQSNAELQKDKNKLKKEKADLLVDIHDVRKENEELAKDLSDCKEALDLANNKLKTKTDEFERKTKEKDCRFMDIVKERDDLISRSKSLMTANENLQRENKSLETEKVQFLATLNELQKADKTRSVKLHQYKIEKADHTMTKEAHQQKFGPGLRVKDSLMWSKQNMGMCVGGVKLKITKILVAAIEIGNSSSSYACSFQYKYEKVLVPEWFSGNQMFNKTSTFVLFDVNQKFHAFGYEAEDKYAELVEEGEDNGWYCFRRFMLKLQEEKIAKNYILVDDKGKKMNAIDVLSAVITYFKDHLVRHLEQGSTGLRAHDIHWVITVPIMWTDTAIQIMREAAYKSGINDTNLTLVSEPEAASVCQTISENSAKSKTQSISSPGTKFMVIDLGDNSASFTVFIRQSDGGLLEVKAATAEACGTNIVESEFQRLMCNIVGDAVYQRYIDEHIDEYLYLQHDLKINIFKAKSGVCGKVTLMCPASLRDTLKEIKDETFTQAIDKSHYRGQITCIGDKLKIDTEVFNNLFKPGTNKIVGYIQVLLKDKYVQDTEMFLMVGEFSMSLLVQEAVIRAFPNINVTIPEPFNADLAIMKGAVIYGHQH